MKMFQLFFLVLVLGVNACQVAPPLTAEQKFAEGMCDCAQKMPWDQIAEHPEEVGTFRVCQSGARIGNVSRKSYKQNTA